MLKTALFGSLAAAVISAKTSPTAVCNKTTKKVDCGFFGITQDICEIKGCCWLPSTVSNTPWCFYSENDKPPQPLPERGVQEWKKRSIYQLITDRFAKESTPSSTCLNLSNYCGGTFKGIVSKLDYIQGMGFDAIWISPVVENTPGGYHGYWAQNLFKINPHFGTEQDFIDLINECHKRGIWVMLDVVANHMGNQDNDNDFSSFVPFDSPDNYHSLCQITNWSDPDNVEFCRLSNLPDLNQDNEFVRASLKDWVASMVSKYKLDGLRIDTVPEVKKQFWSEFSENAGVFSIGEVFNGDPAYVGPYQQAIPGLLNYPMYYTLHDVFGNNRNSLHDIITRLDQERGTFEDLSALGVFMDNHDNARFLHSQHDWTQLKNGLTFVLLGKHIPIVYYGTEQALAGASDPNNREALWPRYDKEHNIYQHIAGVHAARRVAGDDFHASDFSVALLEDRILAFTRGPLLAVITNVGSGHGISRAVKGLEYPAGTMLYNALDKEDSILVQDDGSVEIKIVDGQPKVYLPYKIPGDFSILSPHLVPEFVKHWSIGATAGMAVGVLALVGTISVVVALVLRHPQRHAYIPLP